MMITIRSARVWNIQPGHSSFLRSTPFLVFLYLLSCARFANAELLVYEGFNYSPSGADVAGNSGNGSFGFSGGWTGSTTFDLAPGSLVSPVPFSSPTGNRVTAAAFGGNRDLDRVLSQSLGADNTTAYFSFLMRPEGVVGQGAFGGWFGFSLRAGARNLHVGKDTNHGVYEIDNGILGDVALSSVPVVANQIHLLVLRADFLFGNDVFRLYVDPPSGQPEPLTANATLTVFDVSTITSLGLTGPGAYGFDELRIGTTWADVTAVPEPSTTALAWIGGMAVLVNAGRFIRRTCQ